MMIILIIIIIFKKFKKIIIILIIIIIIIIRRRITTTTTTTHLYSALRSEDTETQNIRPTPTPLVCVDNNYEHRYRQMKKIFTDTRLTERGTNGTERHAVNTLTLLSKTSCQTM